MVVVAHRLATVQNADVIFVLGEGKVLETGNHNQLLRKRGVYFQMVRSRSLEISKMPEANSRHKCQSQALDR